LLSFLVLAAPAAAAPRKPKAPAIVPEDQACPFVPFETNGDPAKAVEDYRRTKGIGVHDPKWQAAQADQEFRAALAHPTAQAVEHFYYYKVTGGYPADAIPEGYARNRAIQIFTALAGPEQVKAARLMMGHDSGFTYQNLLPLLRDNPSTDVDTYLGELRPGWRSDPSPSEKLIQDMKDYRIAHKLGFHDPEWQRAQADREFKDTLAHPTAKAVEHYYYYDVDGGYAAGAVSQAEARDRAVRIFGKLTGADQVKAARVMMGHDGSFTFQNLLPLLRDNPSADVDRYLSELYPGWKSDPEPAQKMVQDMKDYRSQHELGVYDPKWQKAQVDGDFNQALAHPTAQAVEKFYYYKTYGGYASDAVTEAQARDMAVRIFAKLSGSEQVKAARLMIGHDGSFTQQRLVPLMRDNPSPEVDRFLAGLRR
jgi:hypothetical protein